MPVLARKWMGYLKASGVIREMVIAGSHHPAVLDKASEITADLSPMNSAGEAQALWSFVRHGIRYVEDPAGDDHFQAPEVTLRRLAGDCDDQVILLGSLFRSLGFRVRVVFVFRTPPKNYEADFPEHVYLEVNVNKNGVDEMWFCVETIPLPDDHGGYYFAPFGRGVNRGYREFVQVD